MLRQHLPRLFAIQRNVHVRGQRFLFQFVHRANHPRGIARHDRPRRDVARDHAARADHRVRPDRNIREDDRVYADVHVVFHVDFAGFRFRVAGELGEPEE